jgi:hypothetical protein
MLNHSIFFNVSIIMGQLLTPIVNVTKKGFNCQIIVKTSLQK